MKDVPKAVAAIRYVRDGGYDFSIDVDGKCVHRREGLNMSQVSQCLLGVLDVLKGSRLVAGKDFDAHQMIVRTVDKDGNSSAQVMSF